jgi:hypothetical protein
MWQPLNEIGCYLACRDATVSVVTGNANCDTRLVGYRGLCCFTDGLTDDLGKDQGWSLHGKLPGPSRAVEQHAGRVTAVKRLVVPQLPVSPKRLCENAVEFGVT